MLIASNPVNHGRMIRTVSGRYIDVWALQPGDIDIYDIACGLSNTCRYTGQIEDHYSVAEHSIHTALWVQHRKPEWALEALLHDAAEAYLNDISRPIKYQLSDYRALEKLVEDQMFPMLGLKYPFDPIVKQADDAMLRDEWDNMILGTRKPLWDPKTARKMFQEFYEDLVAIRKEDAVQRTT